MKNRFLLTLFALSLWCVSCSDSGKIEPDSPQGPKMEVREISLTATMGAESKTSLTDEDKVVWSAGDRISVFYDGKQSEFVTSNSALSERTDAIFVGLISVPSEAANESLQLYGVYPYSAGYKMENGVIKMALPTDQIAAAGTFAKDMSISAGIGNGLSMKFYNICGLLEFTLERDDVVKVSMSGNNGEILSGSLTVKWDDDGKPVVENISGNNSISLANSDGSCLKKGEKYYLVVPPTEFDQGVHFKFATNDGKVYVKELAGKKTIERSVIKSIENVDKEAIEENGEEGEEKYVVFADQYFEQYCLGEFDKDKDGKISYEEAADVKAIHYRGDASYNGKYWTVLSDGKIISSLEGIEHFVNLETLVCSPFHSNGGLTSLDLSKNTKLKALDVSGNANLLSINISSCTELEDLDCSSPCYGSTVEDEIGNIYVPTGKLASLDITNNTKLVRLDCSGLQLKSLDVSKCTELKNLVAFYNKELQSLQMDSHPKLDSLYLTGCRSLKEVNLTGSPNLTWVAIWRIPDISVDFTNCTKLDHIAVRRLDNITFPDGGLESLRRLDVGFAETGEELELSKFPNLKNLDTWNCTSLDLSACSGLEAMGVHRNLLSGLNISMCKEMHYLALDMDGTLAGLDISQNPNLATFVSADCSTLETLLVAVGQQIEGVTVNRSADVVHPNTSVVQRGEISTEDFDRSEF